MNRPKLLALTLLLFSVPALAEEKVLCELQWPSHDGATAVLQFIFIQDGCAMEGAPRGDCYIARKKDGDSWTLGEGVIQKETSPEMLCLAPQILSGTAERASLVCDEQAHPKSIHLEGPEGRTKTCPLPRGFPKKPHKFE